MQKSETSMKKYGTAYSSQQEIIEGRDHLRRLNEERVRMVHDRIRPQIINTISRFYREELRRLGPFARS